MIKCPNNTPSNLQNLFQSQSPESEGTYCQLLFYDCHKTQTALKETSHKPTTNYPRRYRSARRKP